MRFGTALAFVAAVVSPLLLDCATTCQMRNQNGFVKRDCPVKLTPVPIQDSKSRYSECVTVHVWIKSEDVSKCPKIEIFLSSSEDVFRPTFKTRNKNRQTERKRTCYNETKQYEKQVKCGTKQYSNASSAVWELVHDCIEAKAKTVVSVSYSTTSSSCRVTYTVPDPIPRFDLSVNQSAKSISVTVEPGDKVYTRWCYKKTAGFCKATLPNRITIDPSQSRSAVLNIPYLLPCVCVQAYYTREDSKRHEKCLFENDTLTDFSDVWPSSDVELFESYLMLSLECPASDLKISASLCWRLNEHLCIPVLNTTLERTEFVTEARYYTSGVDKHPQMCVQFSLQGSHNISCRFQPDMSSWEVYVEPGKQSVFLHFTSVVPAKFSAQLCVLNKSECTLIGQVHSVTMSGNTTIMRMNVPLHSLAEKPCVKVWQSDPALLGGRILCPDYTHNRCGMYAVAALIFVVIVALLGVFIHRLTRSGATGWLCIQEPVLLVGSSEQSAHVSAMCALASILQGELNAVVHMALWAQSSQTQTGTGVADLGPLPWLYGQWETVRKAQGKVLIVWSPEANRVYEKQREERASSDKTERQVEDYNKAEVRHEKMRVEMEEDMNLNGRKVGKCKKQKASRTRDSFKLYDDKNWHAHREPSTVIAPVFTAALACLEGALQVGKCQGVALVYFQGLCHTRDIPKAFRGIPRYCLPKDFSGLIQELGGMRRQTKTGKFWCHCWPRLLPKVLSVWLARQLSQRLQTLLPQTQEEKMQGPSVTSSVKKTSDKTQSRLKLPLAANMAGPGTVQEHEPLHELPW